MWFVDDVVRISFGSPKESEPKGAMIIPVHLRSGDVQLDFRVNKQPIVPEVETPPANNRFGVLKLRVPWRTGLNVVEIIGSGGAAPTGPGSPPGRGSRFASRVGSSPRRVARGIACAKPRCQCRGCEHFGTGSAVQDHRSFQNALNGSTRRATRLSW
jgi:hypothetical protein